MNAHEKSKDVGNANQHLVQVVLSSFYSVMELGKLKKSALRLQV